MPGKREWILDDETWNLIEHHGAHRDFFAGTEGLFLLYAEIFVGSTIEVCKIWHTPIIADCAQSVAPPGGGGRTTGSMRRSHTPTPWPDWRRRPVPEEMPQISRRMRELTG